MSPSRSGPSLLGPAAAGIAVIVILSLIGWYWALVPISEGHAGVDLDRGAATGEVHEPGWNYHNPLTHDYEEIETRPTTVNMRGDDSIYVITRDGQDVYVDITIRYEVTDPVQFYEVAKSHQQAVNRFIEPALQSALRDEASVLPTSDLVNADSEAEQQPGIITKEGRTLIEDAATDAVQNSINGTGLTVHAVEVRNVELNEEFSSQLEEIAIEEANAEEKIISARADAEAERERAAGIADANNEIDESLTDAVLMDKYLDSIDEGDTVILATGEDGTPIILDPEDGEPVADAPTNNSTNSSD